MLLAVFTVAAIALVAGIALAYAYQRLPAGDGNLVEEINELLPQTQCAQCGYPGCRPYAAAVAEGSAAINLCPPGGDDDTGGPARYDRIEETGGRLGMITPLSNNFCAGCNRVRVTATGQLYPCLGGGEMVDLRSALRSSNEEVEFARTLDEAMRIKPERHHFRIDERGEEPAQPRHMSVTGG